MSDSMMDRVIEARRDFGGLFGCPIMLTMEVIRYKWAIQIIYGLYGEETPVRFNQIERAIAPITQKELSKRLKELEQHGIVVRTVYAEVPPRVEYALTEKGRALVSVLDTLTEWGEKYARQSADVQAVS